VTEHGGGVRGGDPPGQHGGGVWGGGPPGQDRRDELGHAPGLFPVPGDGVLARRGDLILLCSLDDSQTADDLLDLLEQIATRRGDGRRFTDAIAAALEANEGVPSVLAFGPAGAGFAVTVSGGAWADLRTLAEVVRVEAGHPRLLLRCVLRSPVMGVRGGLSPGDTGAASTDRFSRLDAGTVRAGGLSFFRGATGREGGSADEPAAASDQAVGLGKARGPIAAPAQTPAAEARLAGVPVVQLPEPEPSGPAVGAQPATPPAAAVPPRLPSEAPGAWISPDVPAPAAAQQYPATELWSAPQPGSGAAEEVRQQNLTVPPETFEPAQPFEAVLLFDPGPGSGVDVPPRPPLSKVKDLPPGTSSYASAGPIIQGVYCKNGHFDDPEALFCAICGISMNQQTLVPRPGERPPLGVLLVDDGSVFQLDSDYVVGREPSLDSSVASGKARPLRVQDDSGIVSRVHARVQLDGWRVLVTDLGSANGTKVLLPGQPTGQPIVPQVPVVLATGSQVDLGGRGFRYESHRGR
jgi:hypothetical protein